MTERQSFDYAIFLLSYIVTAVLAVIGAVWGLRAVLITAGTGMVLCIIAAAAVFLRPALLAMKCYRENPPRAMYESISSREGYTRLADMNPALIEAARCAEDTRFFEHKGINWNSVIHALINNVIRKKARVGGSTITQQLIKNVYLDPQAAMSRKLTELLMVSRLERELTKNEIIELYFNVIYFGNGTHGISEASRFYYSKTPAELSTDQCISMVAIIPCPDKYNVKAGTELFSRARQHVYAAMATRSKLRFEELVDHYNRSSEPR